MFRSRDGQPMAYMPNFRLLYFFLKLYWNIAILIHLCTIYSCFCDTIANLSAVTDPQSLKYLLSGTQEKVCWSLLTRCQKIFPIFWWNVFKKKNWVIINTHYYITFRCTNIKSIKWHFEELSTLSKLLLSYVIWGNSHTSVSSPVKWVWCGCKAQYKI